MIYPQFITFDSSHGDRAFPVAVSWSLSDGQLKSVLIIPDDSWEPWENNQSQYDTDYLNNHGATCPEILQELISDMESHELFASDAAQDLHFLEMISESCGQERDIELLPFQLAFEEYDSEELWQEYEVVTEYQGMDLSVCEERVRALVYLAEHLRIDE
jgi:hypothetical protein